VKPATPVTRLVTQPSAVERETGVARFESALDDSDQDVREKAALALAFSSSPDAIPGLLKALADRDAQVREKAAIGLALRRDARVTAALIAAMDDPDPQVREKAAISLGTSGDSRAAAVLERALQDPDSQVREQAAAGLIVLRSSPQDVEHADRVRTRLGGLAGFLISLAR
jgi:HEAT repeat protein